MLSHAARKDHLGLARPDHPRGRRQRIETGSAQTVDRDARYVDRQAGEQGAHPGDIAVIFAGLVRTPEDHVADRHRIERRIAFDEFAQHDRRKIIGADRRKRNRHNVRSEYGSHRR